MFELKFYDEVEDSFLKFAVIVAKSKGKWVFCKQKGRETYECPGGHRDNDENILTTAKRELYEETGALEYTISPICFYSVNGVDGAIQNDEETYGRLFFADISKFGRLPDFEMERVDLFETLPEQWTYPKIQPKLLEKIYSLL